MPLGRRAVLLSLAVLPLVVAALAVRDCLAVSSFFMESPRPEGRFFLMVATCALGLATACYLSRRWPLPDPAPDPARRATLPFALFCIVLGAAFVIERVWIKPYWLGLRIDFEQAQWMQRSAHLLSLEAYGLPRVALWEGWYNNAYTYLLLLARAGVPFDSWHGYQVFSICVAAAATVLAMVALRSFFGSPAAVVFGLLSLGSAYSHFMSLYMKHHITMALLFAVLLLAVMQYWRRPGWPSALLLAVTTLVAFFFYVAMAYYAAMAVLAIACARGGTMRGKLRDAVLVLLPIGLYVAYLLCNPAVWPMEYVTGKSVFRSADLAGTLAYNLSLQLKLALVPGGLWSGGLVLAFYLGLVDIVASRDPKRGFLLGSYGVAVMAKLSVWEQELAHNFITLFPYLCIASLGVVRGGALLGLGAAPKAVRFVVAAALFFAFAFHEVRWFATSLHWIEYNVPAFLQPLRDRLWYFDDARSLSKHRRAGVPVVVDPRLFVLSAGREGVDGLASAFSELHGLVGVVYGENVDPLRDRQVCRALYLSQDAPDALASRFSRPAYEVKLLDEYRPSNPRFAICPFGPDGRGPASCAAGLNEFMFQREDCTRRHYLYEIAAAGC